MISVIDYDAGNLKSVEKALISLGEEVVVSRDSSEILQADKVILPGVGSFGDAMNNLDRFGLVDTIKKVVDNKTPFLGICLGLQLLFKESEPHLASVAGYELSRKAEYCFQTPCPYCQQQHRQTADQNRHPTAQHSMPHPGQPAHNRYLLPHCAARCNC